MDVRPRGGTRETDGNDYETQKTGRDVERRWDQNTEYQSVKHTVKEWDRSEIRLGSVGGVVHAGIKYRVLNGCKGGKIKDDEAEDQLRKGLPEERPARRRRMWR